MRSLFNCIFTICILVLLSSCNAGKLEPEMHGDGLVLIKAPSSCNYSVPRITGLTKADSDSSDGFDELFIDSDVSIGSLHNMPKGSTLWLLIEVPGPGYIYKPSYQYPSEVAEPESWQESEYSYRPYIVGDNGAMYPCQTRDSSGIRDGKPAIFRVVRRDEVSKEIISSGSALMLPPGLYKFHAVSPASPLMTELDGQPQAPSVHISNGNYVQATDIRWKETYPKGVLIRGGNEISGVQHIALASLVNQTAKIKVNIRCGNNVRKLAVQDSGIEISGIQEDSHADFQWTMDGKPIQPRVGNKYEGIVFRDTEEKKDTDGQDMITSWVSILPTDARTNTIFVLFHLIVNNVPTQFMVGLTNQFYEAANEYVFNFRVSIDGNVTVGTWDNDTLIYEDIEL